jgi:2-polyprenyl-3-methyl-5-hydroxy-6-metoxy-1,4-benzoquinol methylase
MTSQPVRPPADPAPPKRRAIRIPRWVDSLFLVLGLAILVYVISRFPLLDIQQACLRLGPWVLITPAIALGWHACNTTALYVLLGRQVPWRALLWNRLVGDGYNALLPMAGLGGEPFKIRHLGQFVATEQAIAALIRDRVLENGMGWIFTAVCIAVTMARFVLPGTFHTGLVLYVIIAPIVGLVTSALVLTRLPLRAGRVLSKLFGKLPEVDSETLAPRTIVTVAFWLLAGRVFGLLEVGSLLWLLDLGVDPGTVMFLDSALNVSGYLGFAIPMGLGVFEGASVFLFSVLGFAGPLAIAFALARRGRMLLVGLLGVALHLLGRGRTARADVGLVSGRPTSQAAWDAQYRQGAWRHLDSMDEMAHYAVLAGYVRELHAAPRVLDVGCGTGRLFRFLEHGPLRAYVGIDLSAQAIAQAQCHARDDVRFEAANFEQWAPTREFDAIVFNESIYYAEDPVAVLSRYAAALSEGGCMIVSVRRKRKNRSIVRAIQRRFTALHQTVVQNEHGHRWDTWVLQRPAVAVAVAKPA